MSENNSNEVMSALLQFANQTIEGNYSYIPNGDLFHGIYKEMYNAILALNKKMRRYVFEVQVASSQVLSATEVLSQGIDESNELTHRLFDDAHEIQELNANSQTVMLTSMNQLKQIAHILREVNSISDEVSSANEQSGVVLQESKSEILEIVDSVENIKKSTDNTFEYIKLLKDSTKEIDGILKIVSGISSQIKLISLNATIESARLGTAGKAFSVIADHIKDLSSKTASEVEQINEIILQINDSMKSLDRQIKQDMNNVDKSVSCSKNTESCLARIEENHSQVQKMIRTIIEATSKENNLADEISNNVNNVETIASKVTSSFEHIYNSVSKQTKNFDELGVLGNCLKNASNSLSILNEKADVDLIEQYSDKFSEQAKSVFDIFVNKILAAPDFANLAEDIHRHRLDEIISNNKFIEAIWTNNEKGKFIYSCPPAGIANAKVREWFRQSVSGEKYISELYISAITKNPCITVSMPIRDGGGKIVGVIGADLKLKV